MKRLTILCSLLAFMLVGCNYGGVTKKTTSDIAPDGTIDNIVVEETTDVAEYQRSAREHTQAEKERIKAQAEAIASVPVAGLSADAQALLTMQKIQSIEKLETTKYSAEAPTTWIDVADNAVDHSKEIVNGMVAIKALGTVEDLVKSAGDTSVTSIGDGTTASGFNSQKTNQTVLTNSKRDAVAQPVNDTDPSSSGSNDDPTTVGSHNGGVE